MSVIYNPSVTASPCQLPLHRGAFGTGKPVPYTHHWETSKTLQGIATPVCALARNDRSFGSAYRNRRAADSRPYASQRKFLRNGGTGKPVPYTHQRNSTAPVGVGVLDDPPRRSRGYGSLLKPCRGLPHQ